MVRVLQALLRLLNHTKPFISLVHVVISPESSAEGFEHAESAFVEVFQVELFTPGDHHFSCLFFHGCSVHKDSVFDSPFVIVFPHFGLVVFTVVIDCPDAPYI